MERYPDQVLQKEWIQDSIDEKTVIWADSFGKFLQSKVGDSQPLTTSQIRKFFGELKRIQNDPEKFKDDIPLLKAKLAYAVGRDLKKVDKAMVNKTKIKEFYEQIEMGISYIRKDHNKDLNNLIKVVEAIVAYHRFHGGE